MKFKSLILRLTFALSFLVFCLLFLSRKSLVVIASELVNIWEPNTFLSYAIANHVSFTHNGKIYVIGGSAALGASHSEVLRSDIGAGGDLSEWSVVSNLPARLIWHSIAKNSNNVYVLGGYLDKIDGVTANVNTVYKASLNSDGSIGSWQTVTNLPQNLSFGSATTAGNKIYYAGGSVSPSHVTDANYAVSTISMASINSTDGTIGSWSTAGNLPDKMVAFNLMEINNYLYVFGGITTSGITSAVKRAPINSDGTIGVWSSQPSFPQGIWLFGLTRTGNMLVTAGGSSGSSIIDKVYYSNINTDGSITDWQTSANNLPRPNVGSPLVSWNNHLYLTGGYYSGGYSNSVFSATVQNGETQQVKNVVFVPGLGGSWDTSSMLSCSFDSNANWGLAPYAETVYTPFLTTPKPSDWSIVPFYYDWRQPVNQNADLLKNLLNSENKKVNLVGHSMGGLVGRAYLEDESNIDKVDGFLSVGSPHKGTPLVYPAWSGGDVWNDNFLAKIAITLYLKFCGQNGPLSNDRETIQTIVPSIRDLLPIDPYLTGTRDFIPPDTANMNAKNTWLLSSSWPISGIKIGSLSGTGFSTLESIPVKKPTKHDELLENWKDGKPAGKTTTLNGDGTVLVASSDIPTAEFHPIITQTHTGLVGTGEGINKIREFLGLPQLSLAESPAFTEPNSALILIGSPANFWVSDTNGNTRKDKDGMVAFINPKSGNYNLSLSPESDNTRFIVAQFLPNGDIKFKEYRFNGFVNRFKILKFDALNPKEDIFN